MADNDVCSRCGHIRSSHHSYAEGGCGSRVRVAKRVKICGCAEFREPVGTPVPLGVADAPAPDSSEALAGLA